MTEKSDIQFDLPAPCNEVAIRGTDEFAVLTALATWANKHQYQGIHIIGLHWRTRWIPDPHPAVDGDKVAQYMITMQFKTTAQLEENWGP